MSALWYRGASRLPADIALSIIPSLPRPHLERLAQQIIDHLDDQDGDADLETALDTEDDEPTQFAIEATWEGPGCEISDAYGVQDEDGCNMPSAYIAERNEHPGAGCRFADSDMAASECGLSIGGTP